MARAKRMSGAKSSHKARKERKSFTLSSESVTFLKELRLASNGRPKQSVSSVLDILLQRLQRERKRQAIEQAIGNYYDGRAQQLQLEDEMWGDFSLAQLVNEDQ